MTFSAPASSTTSRPAWPLTSSWAGPDTGRSRCSGGTTSSTSTTCGAPGSRPAATWTCPRRADTPDVGVSPRGGSPNGEEGGGERGTPTAAAVVHAGVQGGGHYLGAAGRAVVASDLPRARPE